jgi:predicted dehydrogenase
MINIGVIGYGYWGPKLVRNFHAVEHTNIKIVVDIDTKKLESVQAMYPSVEISTEINSVLTDPEIDGVVIATPISQHYELAKKALLHDKHVLIEKPITDSTQKAEDLINIANKKRRTLMVDHTFVYSAPVNKIKQLISANEIGDIQYFDSTRINLGLFQHDINVIWDLAPHDISILLYLIKEKPYSVICTGISHIQNKLENIAYITLYYQSNFMAHFTSSWTSPVKIRKILIGGTNKMIVYNDLEITEKVKVYNSGYEVILNEDLNKILVDYRIGDIYIPRIEQKEPLRNMAEDFINTIRNRVKPISDCESGLEVVSILEAASKSLKNRGKEIKL